MKILITGGCGFMGSNLAKGALERGHEVIVLDSLYRTGSEQNFEWLKKQGELTFYRADVRNREDIEFVIGKEQPDAVFHVAGQVAMTTSLERPRFDFETNVLGTFNVLDTLRKLAPNTPILFSSTNKVYGDLEHYEYQETDTRYKCPHFPEGFNESTPLDFRTPYGCSKGAAEQYIKDFHLSFGLKTVYFRHSSIYGGRQFSTFDQGWVGWFVSQAVKKQKDPSCVPFTIAGNGKQVRDVLYASDIVECYFKALGNIDKIQGESFNIGGGMDNSLSLLELFNLLESKLNISLNFDKLAPRASDQKVFVADITKAKQMFDWSPQVSKDQGIEQMIEWTHSLS